jgi:hypothetical protein
VLFTVALFQVVFLLEQFFDRRMISSSTTQLRRGAPSFIASDINIARTREDHRITRIRFSPTRSAPSPSRTDELHRRVSTTCGIQGNGGNNRATLTLKAGETVVSKPSIAMVYFTQLNALGMSAE